MLLLDDIKDLPSSKWDMAFDPKGVKRLRAAATRARPYSFDVKASHKIGQFSVDCIDLVASNMEFAIPPFDTTYIEIDINETLRGTGRVGSMPSDDPEADWRLGFLIDNGMIWTMSNSRVHRDAAVGPWAYLDTSFHSGDAGPFVWNSRSVWAEMDQGGRAKAALLAGSSSNDLDRSMLSKFIDRFDVVFVGPQHMSKRGIDDTLAGCIGEIRFLVAALLFIQSKRGVSIGGVPFERKMARGKSRVFMAHSTVTIDLEGPAEMRRAFSITDRASPRAHEVPAHFAHRYGDLHCEHRWIARVDEPTHWDCPLCGRFRYLRKQHMRGDASLGFVTRDYNVIAEGK